MGRHRLLQYIQRPALRDVLLLSSGRLGAVAVGLVSAPVITRLFKPEDFGVAATIVAFSTPMSIVFCLAYHNAIVLPHDDREAGAISKLAVTSSILICLSCYLLIAAFENILGPVFSRIGQWVWVVPVLSFLLSLSLIFEGWMTRKKQFASSARAIFSQALAMNGGRIVTGATWGSGVSGLVYPYFAGSVLFLGLLYAGVRKFEPFNAGKQSILTVAGSYSDFSKLNLPAGFVRSLSDNLPVLLLGMMFGPASAGLYAICDRLLKAPLMAAITSVRRVYLQLAVQAGHEEKDLKNLYVRATANLAVGGFIPLLALMMVGKPLLAYLLGEKWYHSGDFVVVLAPWFYILLVSRPATAMLDVKRKQRVGLVIQIVTASFRLAFMFLAWKIGLSATGVIWAFVIAGIFPLIWLVVSVNTMLNE